MVSCVSRFERLSWTASLDRSRAAAIVAPRDTRLLPLASTTPQVEQNTSVKWLHRGPSARAPTCDSAVEPSAKSLVVE